MFGRILAHVVDSAFGTDEFESYSATYSWLSNQMAHTMMGFFLACAFVWMPIPFQASRHPEIRSLAHKLKAAWDRYPWLRFIAPYLLPTIKLVLDALVLQGRSSVFPIDWSDFWHDKMTDLTFWFLGMLTAHAVLIGPFVSTRTAELPDGERSPASVQANVSVEPRPGGWGSESRAERWIRNGVKGALHALAGVARRLLSCLFITIPSFCWPCRRLIGLVALIVVITLGYFQYEYWTAQKETFDRAFLPSGWTRLCEFDVPGAFAAEATSDPRNQMEDETRRYMAFVEAAKPDRVVHCVIAGGHSAHRSALAVALGSEFAARRKPVYYHTAAKLLEGPEDLLRWKQLAANGGDEHKIGDDHPYFPKCMIIDDLPSIFPEPLTPQQRKVPFAERQKIQPPVLKKDEPYDRVANSRKIFEHFHVNRDRISTIWVLTCRPSEADAWAELIDEYLFWGRDVPEEERDLWRVRINLGRR